MKLLSDREIRDSVSKAEKLNNELDISERLLNIEPFLPYLEESNVISYGLSSFGYDIRLSKELKKIGSSDKRIIDPKEKSNSEFNNIVLNDHDNYFELKPHGFILGCSVETITVPSNILGLCVGKSTYARCGIIVNVTPLEPGWFGQLTIEISNTSDKFVRLYFNEGIAQILFFEMDNSAEKTYLDRNGKYMNQVGVVLPRVKSNE